MLHVPAADLTPRDLAAVPIGLRVIDHAVVEMRRNLFRPGMEIVTELRADAFLVVQSDRRQMREFAFETIDLVHHVFFAQMGIHVEDLHRVLPVNWSAALSATPKGLAITII